MHHNPLQTHALNSDTAETCGLCSDALILYKALRVLAVPHVSYHIHVSKYYVL